MSSPIPPGPSLRDRGVAAGQITPARRLGVMAIALALAVLVWAVFRLRQAEPRETRSDSGATVPDHAARP